MKQHKTAQHPKKYPFSLRSRIHSFQSITWTLKFSLELRQTPSFSSLDEGTGQLLTLWELCSLMLQELGCRGKSCWEGRDTFPGPCSPSPAFQLPTPHYLHSSWEFLPVLHAHIQAQFKPVLSKLCTDVLQFISFHTFFFNACSSASPCQISRTKRTHLNISYAVRRNKTNTQKKTHTNKSTIILSHPLKKRTQCMAVWRRSSFRKRKATWTQIALCFLYDISS